ncbi:MAG TPA: thiamine pyrophosphate-binding protein [Candidatus Binatia bacterium]|nr:thiamine pyrophosphate-binding protein [Candidatus Binatia bacterium]
MISTQPAALSIDGAVIADAIRALGVTHVISVPDTHLRTAMDLLDKGPVPKMIYVCTEDEAMGINAGLYITGHKPMLLIQNNGLYACVNTLKAIPLDAQVPTFMLIGQFGRDVTKSVEENPKRAVNRLEPTLETWGVPFFRIDGPSDVPKIRTAWDIAWEKKGPAAAIVGAPTT